MPVRCLRGMKTTCGYFGDGVTYINRLSSETEARRKIRNYNIFRFTLSAIFLISTLATWEHAINCFRYTDDLIKGTGCTVSRDSSSEPNMTSLFLNCLSTMGTQHLTCPSSIFPEIDKQIDGHLDSVRYFLTISRIFLAAAIALLFIPSIASGISYVRQNWPQIKAAFFTSNDLAAPLSNRQAPASEIAVITTPAP